MCGGTVELRGVFIRGARRDGTEQDGGGRQTLAARGPLGSEGGPCGGGYGKGRIGNEDTRRRGRLRGRTWWCFVTFRRPRLFGSGAVHVRLSWLVARPLAFLQLSRSLPSPLLRTCQLRDTTPAGSPATSYHIHTIFFFVQACVCAVHVVCRSVCVTGGVAMLERVSHSITCFNLHLKATSYCQLPVSVWLITRFYY